MYDANPAGDFSDRSPVLEVKFGAAGAAAYSELSAEYLSTLSAPLDDMWATFSDGAEHAALVVDHHLAGCAAVDRAGDLQRFFVRPDYEQLGHRLLRAVVDARLLEGVIASTMDPALLSLTLPYCTEAEKVALVYHHASRPAIEPLEPLRHAETFDLAAVVRFTVLATDATENFAEPYTAERIDRREMFLHEIDGEIVGLAERRLDERLPGHAHLGMIVGPDHRNRGFGSRLMIAMVRICAEERLTPLCSTGPDNIAAQRAIRNAGFHTCHSILRLHLEVPRTTEIQGDI